MITVRRKLRAYGDSQLRTESASILLLNLKDPGTPRVGGATHTEPGEVVRT